MTSPTTGVAETDAPRLGYVPGLDGLRGIAVAMVLLSHIRILDFEGLSGIAAVDGFFEGGFLGVNLFFVLSGFLITSLLLEEDRDSGRVRFGNFYVRRALRLLPALLVLLLAHAIYAYASGLDRHDEVRTVGGALFYVSNWLTAFRVEWVVPDLGHLWSLAVEEQFYLVWPAVLILFLKLRRATTVAIAVLVALVAIVVLQRTLLWESGRSNWVLLIPRIDVEADSLLIGVIAGWLWMRGLVPKRHLAVAGWLGAAVIVACFAGARADEPFIYLGGFTLFAIATAFVILATVGGTWTLGRALAWRPLRALGRVSYGVYLWHLPVFFVVARYGSQWKPMTRVVVALAGTAVATMLSWKIVERPALNLKSRLAPRVTTGHLEGSGSYD